ESVALGGGQASTVAVVAQMAIDTFERSGGRKKADGWIDRDSEAERGQPRCRQNWRAAAFNHVREERCIDLLTDARELLLGLRALHKDDIGAGTRVELATAYRFAQPERRARVGAGNHQEVGAVAGLHRDLDLECHLLSRDHAPSGRMTALLRQF